LANLAPDGVGTMMLLSDGTVMAVDGNLSAPASRNRWFKLTPGASGSYANGTWSSLPSMGLQRLYFGSNVLPDGRVFVQGGEYSGPSGAQNFTNTGEIYNPVTNTWSPTANFPQSQFGDDPTMVLPDRRVLGGFLSGPQTFIYNPATNSWSATGTKLRGDQSDEETWIKLPNDSVLSYDIFHLGNAQRYVPSSGTWVDAGPAPNNLSSSAVGEELGGAVLLPDGRVWQLGGTNHTAFYNTATGTWSAGPDFPNNAAGQTQGADDAPVAMLPNGKVLLSVDHPLFNSPTNFYEFDPATNGFTNVTAGASAAGLNVNQFVFPGRMLVLPNGQVLATTGGNRLALYTPDGLPNTAWKPTISSIAPNGDGTFRLTGTQINGLSAGASYGDDAEMDSNYPIVRLKSTTHPRTFYATTFNWDSTSVATGDTPRSTDFALPAGITPDNYTLQVVANGIGSNPVPFTVPPGGPAPDAGSWHAIPAAQETITTTTVIDGANGGPRPVPRRAQGTAALIVPVTATGSGTGSAPAAVVSAAAVDGDGVGAAARWQRMAVFGYSGPGSGTVDSVASSARVTDVSADAARDPLFAAGDQALQAILRNA
jgi:hypothetical protein